MIKEIKEILRTYRKIVILYSGGKDSTLTVHLTLEALLSLPTIESEVFVLAVDTLVEIPLIREIFQKYINELNKWSDQEGLNIKGVILQPEKEDRFWSLLIGKGYPMPHYKFRWCVDRLKIKPVARFINNQKPDVVLLGSRLAESSTRAKNLKRRLFKEKWQKYHTRGMGKGFNIRSFLPILEWTTEDVWKFLRNDETPWGWNYEELFEIYRIVNHGANGNARFGCWVCSVVKNDRTLESIANAGDKLAQDFLKFKRFLVNYTRKAENRTMNAAGKPSKLKLDCRRFLLEKLLKFEKKCPRKKILTEDEHRYILKCWQLEEGGK